MNGCFKERDGFRNELRDVEYKLDSCLNSKNESILADAYLDQFNFVLYFRDNPKVTAVFFR